MIKKLTFIAILILELIACSQNFYNKKLMKAIKNNDIKKISSILKKQKADINHISEVEGFNNFTPLIFASYKGNYEIVKLLIENGANINAKNNYSNTALMLASENGNLEAVKFLVENGADINAKSENGTTALILAYRYGNLEILKFLVKSGADMNAKDENGNTALIEVSRNNNVITEALTMDRIALRMNTINRNLEILKFLVKNGADVNAKNKDGNTPLILASKNWNWKAVKFLVWNGADINAKDKDGKTALMYAVKEFYLINGDEMVKFLVENGADINAKDNDGNTALSLAREESLQDFGYLRGEEKINEIIKILKEAGAK